MANEGINGSYGDSSFPAQQSNGAPANPSQSEQPSKEEVAWYFVESYYTTMSRTPEKLYLFFNKRSRMVQGTEEKKAPVSAGQKAIQERIEKLNFQDCKVRVTNVDSQASDENIVIQVIGEMSNKSQPHRKFVQTFVLAGQTNGYFVLNDIFRYIAEDEEEVVPEAAETETEAHSEYQEPVPTANDSALKSLNETEETITHEPDVTEVDKKLEEVAHEEENAEEEATPATNGTPVPEVAEEEPPAPNDSAPEEPEAEEPPVPAAEEPEQVEEPKAPVPTPAPVKATTPVAAAPPKPAVPKSWAQLVAPKTSVAPTPAPAPAAAPQPKAAAPSPAAAQPKAAATSSPAPPVRQPSPTGSQQDGWQTAGADHNRSKSRAQAPTIVGPDGKVRAFIKNVYAGVDAEELKAHLNKFGELVYFDVNRTKNSAFGEFKSLAGFQAAVAANPHSVGGVDDIFVEERRPAVVFNGRGGARGGRGGFERPAGQGRGGGAPRGAFGGANRGRGGTATPRGRGAPAA